MQIIKALIALTAIAFLFFLSSCRDSALYSEAEGSAAGDYSCKDCNLIIVSMTNVRADHLGYNDYFRDTTPNIDRFAAGSLIFDNAFSHASWTLPAGNSLFTSTYPFTHKVMDRWAYINNANQTRFPQALGYEIMSLPEILKPHGYVTAAFTGGFDYDGRHGLVSRFDYAIYPEYNLERPARYGTFDQNLKSVKKWLRDNKDRKFFLFFQGFNAHCPYTYPVENDVFDSEYRGSVDFSKCLWTFDRVMPVMINNKTYYNLRMPYSDEAGFGASVRVDERDIYHMVALYDGEIQLVDKLLKDFFDEITKLSLEKNTIIVLVSEHGDMFGKHGRFMRGGPLRGTFYDDVLKVPLIIKHPSLEPKKIKDLVQLIDVAPTLLDFLGIPKASDFEGKSLLPLIMENKTVNDFVLAGSMFTPSSTNEFFDVQSIVTAIRTNEHKLINEKLFDANLTLTIDSYEFYNLSSDPEELTNIYSSADSALLIELKEKLSSFELKIGGG